MSGLSLPLGRGGATVVSPQMTRSVRRLQTRMAELRGSLAALLIGDAEYPWRDAPATP